MRKLIFITTRLFWPTDSGRKVVLYNYCKGLHEIYGYDIYLYSFLEDGQSVGLVKEKPDFIKEIKIAKPIKNIVKFNNLIFKSMIARWPFQNSVYYSRANYKAIKEFCENIEPDVVIVDMIRLAPYYNAFRSLSCKKILDLDDMLSKRYERQVNSNNAKAQILGTYSGKVGKSSKKLLDVNLVKKYVLKSESKRVALSEKKYGRIYDSVIFVSHIETREFNRMIPNKAFTVSLGVDYSYYAEASNVCKEKGGLAFLGNLKVSANIDSLDMIINNILPKLNFDYTLYVVGAASSELQEKYSNDRIIFCGRVDDVRQIVKRCELFVSPIAYGTGIKTKILEAMAMGMPVITNSVGAEGIDAINGEHFIVEDDLNVVADIVNNLIGDENRKKALSFAAQNLMKEKYDWKVIYQQLKMIES